VAHRYAVDDFSTGRPKRGNMVDHTDARAAHAQQEPRPGALRQ
jgi:hypothetical protein